MELTERYARKIAELRGVDPEGPITIGNIDGTSSFHEVAWEGYKDMAEQLLALHDKEPDMTDEPLDPEVTPMDDGPGGHVPPPPLRCTICQGTHATADHPRDGGDQS